jgi:phage replication-related protein YjqB (UPF0714/DUF867 family)
MSAYRARVRKAFSGQSTLVGEREHCSADPARLAAIGRALGHQVRVKRSDGEYALYTVSEIRDEAPDHVVRMAQAARERLGTTDEFDASVEARGPHPTDTDAEAEAHGELVERLDDDGTATGLVVLAPHGGLIERHTDRQAERLHCQLASRGVTSWRCKGWKPGGGAYARWHITSTEIHEASFPLLGSISSRQFAYAVAFHGFGEADILIGGAAPTPLKEDIKAAIEAVVGPSGIPVRIARPKEQYGGDDARNIVNRLSGQNGVQIEQSLEARQAHWEAIADAVASVYASKV